VFPRPEFNPPGLCYTLYNGHLDINRDGRRALLSISGEGTIWEIDLHTGEVLWEYVYVHPGGDGVRQEIRTAKYMYEAGFLDTKVASAASGEKPADRGL
jgi:hypothetical protein